MSKPFPEASEALLNYKPKESWIKGVFKKNKGNFEAIWPLENLFTHFIGEFLVLTKNPVSPFLNLLGIIDKFYTVASPVNTACILKGSLLEDSLTKNC